MVEKFQLKGSIYEVNFGYHSKMGGYTTLMLDITEVRRHFCYEKFLKRGRYKEEGKNYES